MKYFILAVILIAGCSQLTARKELDTPPKTELDTIEVQAPIPVPTVTVVTPNVKYKVYTPKPGQIPVPETYKAYLPRVQKFFEILVNDKTILDSRKFTYTEDSGDTIRSKIMQGFDIELRVYKPGFFRQWSKVIAYHDDWTLNFNSNKLNRSECDVIGTIAHESFHGLDYRHGDGLVEAKDLDSLPYWGGEKAVELCKAGVI